VRAQASGGEVYVAYPHATPSVSPRGARAPEVRIEAQRVLSFVGPPYAHYRSQRANYQASAHLGSARCHREAAPRELVVNDLDAVVWRQEGGEPAQSAQQLRALGVVEPDTLVYLTPRLALDPRFGSKVIPGLVDPRFVPRSFHTSLCAPGASAHERAVAAVQFVREELRMPETVIAKPLHGNNGVGISALETHPVTKHREHAVDDADEWTRLIELHGDMVAQEYLPSVRKPAAEAELVLAEVLPDRRDFGEVRFLLIDGEVPRDAAGFPCRVARRVPSDNSLIADSGISYATSLSAAELAFLETLGPLYRRWGIHFGGGDLIRTADPQRPFLFTDAARSVCGHAVVTGALNGEPYLIVDQVLDSLDRQIEQHRHARDGVTVSRTVAVHAAATLGLR
jgi:hypothetical protein